jgi:methylenetetrahydrofolate reductase (NADPH)
MKLTDIFATQQPVLSFEVFPTKPDMPLDTVYETVGQLREMHPSFISVTYGAGGSQKGRTVEIAARIKQVYQIDAMAHLTCVGHRREEIERILGELQRVGVENVLALRGDPPANQPDFDYHQGDFHYANQLIEFIRNKSSFSIAAAAYPEGHKACPRISRDWQNLKRKVDAGVDVLVTQLFFDNRVFFHFLETVRAMGIRCPIVPGIMPVFHEKQIKRILTLCGASMPPEILLMMEKYGNSAEDLRKAGIDHTVRQIQELLANGVEGIHLEPMNKPELARQIIAGVGGALRGEK